MSVKLPQIKKKREVLHLRTPDHRYSKIPIDFEEEFGLRSDNYEGAPYYIAKNGPGWTGDGPDLFLVAEGVPATTYITKQGPQVCTVPEFLKFAWGSKELYDKMPPEMKAALEGRWGATVTVKPIDLEEMPKVFNKLTAAGLLRQHLINMLRTFAISEPEPDRMKTIVTLIIPMLMAFFAGIIANSRGWF